MGQRYKGFPAPLFGAQAAPSARMARSARRRSRGRNRARPSLSKKIRSALLGAMRDGCRACGAAGEASTGRFRASASALRLMASRRPSGAPSRRCPHAVPAPHSLWIEAASPGPWALSDFGVRILNVPSGFPSRDPASQPRPSGEKPGFASKRPRKGALRSLPGWLASGSPASSSKPRGLALRGSLARRVRPGMHPRGAARKKGWTPFDETQRSGAPRPPRPFGLRPGRASSLSALLSVLPARLRRAFANPLRPGRQRAESPRRARPPAQSCGLPFTLRFAPGERRKTSPDRILDSSDSKGWHGRRFCSW